MQAFRIALKNVRRNPRRSILLGIAIAFGFLVLTLVNGFTGGAMKTLRANLSELIGGQVLIMGAEVTDRGTLLFALDDNAVLQQALSTVNDEVLSYSKRTFTSALLLFGKNDAAIEITGVDIDSEKTFLDAVNFIEGTKEDFASQVNGILLPLEIINALNTKVGESILIKAKTQMGQINVIETVITGSISSGQSLETTAYTHIDKVNELVGLEDGQFSIYGLHLKNLSNIDQVTDRLFTEFGRIAQVAPADRDILKNDWEGRMYALDSINTILKEFVELLTIVQKVSLGIFVIVLLIIMVGLMNSYRMIMLERTSEIGTMRAMGVPKTMIRNIFFWEALFVVFAGAVVGLGIAFLTMGILSQIDISQVGDLQVILKNDSLYFYNSLRMIILSIVLLTVMSVLAVFFPARAAANLQPAEALRATH